jgi:hypothetical protein
MSEKFMSGIEEGRLDKPKDEACLLLYERHEALCLVRRYPAGWNVPAKTIVSSF